MKLIIDEENDLAVLDTECTDLDDDGVTVTDVRGFGNVNIKVGHQYITWETFDQLKLAMKKAEYLWRNN